MEYLFNVWGDVEKRIGKNNLFIFLDFDGTLAPIVSTPKKAVLPKTAKKLLEKMSRNPHIRLAFISGRRLEDIKSKIKIKNAIYSGNHGLQLEGPKMEFEPFFISPRYRMIVSRIKSDLGQKIAHIHGALVEDKGIVLSLHYRLVDKKKIAELKTIFYETVILHLASRKIEIKEGKQVLEVCPPVEWNKGKMVLWLLAQRLFELKGGKIFPVYIGDDVTDEDAFRAIRNKGLTIFVGKPKKTHAQYYVRDHNEVHALLKRILGKYDGGINKGKGTL